MGCRVLFISIDGVTDPLGQSQVLPYLHELARRGFAITIISCEKEQNFAVQEAAVRKRIEEAGIQWRFCFYQRRFPLLSQRGNLARLKALASAEASQHKGRVVAHCRSYLAGLIGLRLKRETGARFLFDMRGFWADERRDGGIWKTWNPLHNWLYRYFKNRENLMLREADFVVTLTEKSRSIVCDWVNAEDRSAVIPCCADLDHFHQKDQAVKEELKKKLNIAPASFVWGYLGSLGTWYMLEEMLDLFAEYLKRNNDAVLLFVTPDDPKAIMSQASARNIPPDRVIIRAATRQEVPAYISVFDAGLFFIRPTFSKLASSPTKMAEILACGIPVVTNSGVGDTAEIIRSSGCGLIVDDFTVASYEQTFNQLYDVIAQPPAFFRAAAEKHFSLAQGAATYESIYHKLCER